MAGDGPRPTWGGLYFDGVELREAHLVHEGGSVSIEDGPAQGHVDHTGLILRAPVNAHTHLGDTAMRGTHPVPADLATAVAPPSGVKHRFLASATPEQARASIRQGLDEAATAGMSVVADFRESGPAGVARFREAQAGGPAISGLAFGRPAEPVPDVDACVAVARVADGLGLSALADVAPAVADAYADAARKTGKPLALHLSEARREDVHRAIALEPAFVVHGCHATGRDIEALADAGIGLVMCPRSNARFGVRPPVALAHAKGIVWALGTDNGWFNEPDVWQEASHVIRHVKGVPPEAILSALTVHGRKVLNLNERVPAYQGHPAHLVVLDADLGARDPVASALRTAHVRAVLPG